MSVTQGDVTRSERHVEQTGYCWQPRALNVWVAMPPTNPLQHRVLDLVRTRLEDKGCIFVDDPAQPTRLGPVAHLALGFADNYEDEITPIEFLSPLPKPRGMGMAIATVGEMPEGDLFDIARGLLVKHSGHVGIVVEGDETTGEVRRVLWASMAGNYRLLQGGEARIFDDVALRMLVHIGAEKLTGHAGDVEDFITWEQWRSSPIHEELARAARRLGTAGVIEDQVPLEDYGSSAQVRHVLSFLNRSALGEGMRSQLDPDLRVMGVTTTGGGKVYLSPDPMDGQIVPIGHIRRDGYVRAIPAGCPVTFNAPSVETHENAMVYLAGALVNAGLVDSFDGFLAYLDEYFTTHGMIDVLPEGMTPKVTKLEHFHRQPKAGTINQPDRIEIVYPDEARFPQVDFPCGVREAEYHLLSAMFESEAFRKPGKLDGMVFAVLPGHGAVAVYDGPRDEMIDLITGGMELEEVERV
jgi:hypothetical protein